MMVALAKHPVTRVHDLGWSVWALDSWQLFLLGLSSVIGIGLGHTFYYISIARLGVAVTSGVLQLQPFCVAVFRFALMGVLMTAGQWVSGSVAVGGAMVLLWAQWTLTRRGGATMRQKASGLPPIAGAESEGVEAAEMDAIPVQSDGLVGRQTGRDSGGNCRRHTK
jgi:drug/metabolite transporter (DMT)-like permease